MLTVKPGGGAEEAEAQVILNLPTSHADLRLHHDLVSEKDLEDSSVKASGMEWESSGTLVSGYTSRFRRSERQKALY